jgi:hypothetical protein
VGGLLAKPAEGFPSVFSPDGLFGKYPFLLPNLFCAVLLLVSITGGALLLQETHPDLQPQAPSLYSSSVETPLIATAGATSNPGVDLRAESYGTFNDVSVHSNERWRCQTEGSKERTSSPQKEVAFTSQVVMFIIALGIFTYHSMTFDHLLPIFLQDKNHVLLSGSSFPHISGGLGLSTQTVGIIMSVDGLIALFIQSVLFPPLADWLGVWRLFVMVTILHPITYFIVPFLACLPPNLVFTGIYICLIIRNILSIIAYPVLLILIKQSTPSSCVMGKINGLAASAGAACRTIAPPVSGLLYSTGTQIGCTPIAWWGSSVIALAGILQLWFIKRRKDTVTIRAAVPCLAAAGPPSAESHPREVIHVLGEPDF